VTLEEFLAPPTREAWYAELDAGWSGPDGSSLSFDDLEGVRIGITSKLWRYAGLPANRHDWRYHLGRKHKLPESYRTSADAGYRDGCRESVANTLIGWRVKAGAARAYARWAGLRVFGWAAWRREE
jgi:hypothetical protein